MGIQAQIEVMVFTLICCEDQAANPTGLEELPLKVLDEPLAHGCCHSVWDIDEVQKYTESSGHHTWLVHCGAEIPQTNLWQPAHILQDPQEIGH